LASERAASWGASQLYLILAGVILGPAALGGLKAAQGLVAGPTTLVINASGSFGLPEATKQLAERGWTGMMRVSRFITGAGVVASVACGIVIFVAAPELLKLLYGPDFVKYAACARLFAIAVVLSAFNVGPIITLTATRQVRPLFLLQLAKLAFGIAAVAVLATAYGVTGAAASYVLTVALSTVAIVALQSWARRSLEDPTSRSVSDAVRSRLMRNTRLLLALSPEPQTPASPSESTEPHL
jgi:O-antigen/teichoic acid export membrane protein